MKTALVTGAGGFVAHHLVKFLKSQGYWVKGVDIKNPEFSDTSADEFELLDLREYQNCEKAFLAAKKITEVYHLAADMGGMGFIHSAACDIMRNSALININMINAASRQKVDRYFFSSSVCIYRNMKIGEPELNEEQAYPAMPDNEYGWEKLYAERMALAYGKEYGFKVRIARFQNCFGPEGTWGGGREKAPAALCRKVAESPDGGTIEVWGDGSAVRSYTYVDDMVEGIYRLTQSELKGPANIGNPEYVSVDELAAIIARVAKKNVLLKHVDGPVGVESRNFSNAKIYSTGWKSKFSTEAGIRLTYPWIEAQVKKASGVLK